MVSKIPSSLLMKNRLLMLFFVIILKYLLMFEKLNNFDQIIVSQILQMKRFWLLDEIFIFFSLIGSYGIIWILLLGFFIVKAELKRHDDRFIFLFFSGFGVTLILNTLLKLLTHRLRPLASDLSKFALIKENMLLPISYPTDFSFPSLHAMLAFTAATLLSSRMKKHRLKVYFVATLISFSRVYLTFHFPSDVICGMILGFLIGKLWMRLNFFGFQHHRV